MATTRQRNLVGELPYITDVVINNVPDNVSRAIAQETLDAYENLRSTPLVRWAGRHGIDLFSMEAEDGHRIHPLNSDEFSADSPASIRQKVKLVGYACLTGFALPLNPQTIMAKMKFNKSAAQLDAYTNLQKIMHVENPVEAAKSIVEFGRFSSVDDALGR